MIKKALIAVMAAIFLCLGIMTANVYAVEPNTQLTPTGNGTLVDSISGGNKEFITITTRQGHYFYIVIDRDSNGNETVHFLNQVDDADLAEFAKNNNSSSLSLFGDTSEKVETNKEETTTVSEETTTDLIPREEATSLSGNTQGTQTPVTAIAAMVLICVIAAAGIGVLLYRKFNKKKKKGADTVDNFDEFIEDDFNENDFYEEDDDVLEEQEAEKKEALPEPEEDEEEDEDEEKDDY